MGGRASLPWDCAKLGYSKSEFFSSSHSPTYSCLCFCQDYASEHSACLSSADNSPHDSVSRSILLNRLEFETAFASFSAFLIAVIHHRESVCVCVCNLKLISLEK